MRRRNQQVAPHEHGWAVDSSGSQRISFLHRTHQEAINAGSEIAWNQRAWPFIHRPEGKIRKLDSQGNDPNPGWMKPHDMGQRV